VGSKAMFTDNSGSGIVGRVVENKPNEVLSLEYEGEVVAGVEEYHSEIAKGVKGSRETYRLSEKGDITSLSIECDMAEQYFDYMSAAWDKALEKIKELASKNKTAV
jgi:hypothetical protein